MTPWLPLDIALALAAIIAAALYVTRTVPPEEGNRPRPPSLQAECEEARRVALQRATARAEAWRQLDARMKGRHD